MKNDFDLHSFLIQGLRRLSYRWPIRSQIKTRARIARGQYKCEICGAVVGPTEIRIDHIESVISLDKGFENWDTYIKRLFCSPDNLQAICLGCNKEKTFLENQLRKQFRDEKKIENQSDFIPWKKEK